MTPEQITALIEAGMPDAQVIVKSDDNTHFEAQVISSAFDGVRSLQRHQKVYATLGELMGREIHAMALQTFTEEEWQAQ
ncbi:MAG: BolA family protein [Gammaproteobacteria bacterium]